MTNKFARRYGPGRPGAPGQGADSASAAVGTQGVNANIGSVSGAAGDTGAAAGQVLGASQEMARQAEGLPGQVVRFLSEVCTT